MATAWFSASEIFFAIVISTVAPLVMLMSVSDHEELWLQDENFVVGAAICCSWSLLLN